MRRLALLATLLVLLPGCQGMANVAGDFALTAALAASHHLGPRPVPHDYPDAGLADYRARHAALAERAMTESVATPSATPRPVPHVPLPQ